VTGCDIPVGNSGQDLAGGAATRPGSVEQARSRCAATAATQRSANKSPKTAANRCSAGLKTDGIGTVELWLIEAGEIFFEGIVSPGGLQKNRRGGGAGRPHGHGTRRMAQREEAPCR